jgi:hypothetical protein
MVQSCAGRPSILHARGTVNREHLLERMQEELELNADPVFRIWAAEYCQRDVGRFLRVRPPIVRQIGASYFQEIKFLGIAAILQLCERLLEDGSATMPSRPVRSPA